MERAHQQGQRAISAFEPKVLRRGGCDQAKGSRGDEGDGCEDMIGPHVAWARLAQYWAKIKLWVLVAGWVEAVWAAEPPALPPLPAAPAPARVSVTLAWDPSPSPGVTRYRVYWGPSKGRYTNYVETPLRALTIPGLMLPQYFAATALSTNGLESEYSAEVGGRPVWVVWAEARTNLVSGSGWARWTELAEAVVERSRLPGELYLRLGLTNEWR
jgi:hypothetical protein